MVYIIVTILMLNYPGVPVEISQLIGESVVESSKRLGVEESTILGIMEQESRFNAMAKDAGAGCIGLMQINPKHWGSEDMRSIRGNIYHGTRIIADLQNQGFKIREVLRRYHGLGSDGRYEYSVLKNIEKWRKMIRDFGGNM